MASSCKEGYYFCNSSQKCKKIPRGHKVQSDGELVREYVSDWRSELSEGEKKKGLDGKECWDGYKLAGTKKKGGKTVDNCVKVKEDSEYGYDKEGKSLNPDDKPLKDQTNKQVASVTFDGGGTDGGATIQGSGDSREVPTFVNLIMNKIRARGIK